MQQSNDKTSSTRIDVVNDTPLLQVRDVVTSFDIKQKGSYFWQKPATLKAVNGVSVSYTHLRAHET